MSRTASPNPDHRGITGRLVPNTKEIQENHRY